MLKYRNKCIPKRKIIIFYAWFLFNLEILFKKEWFDGTFNINTTVASN